MDPMHFFGSELLYRISSTVSLLLETSETRARGKSCLQTAEALNATPPNKSMGSMQTQAGDEEAEAKPG